MVVAMNTQKNMDELIQYERDMDIEYVTGFVLNFNFDFNLIDALFLIMLQ